MAAKGKIYLIPNTLGDVDPSSNIPKEVYEAINKISYFIVENEKEARRYLKKLNIEQPLQELILYPLNKRTSSRDISAYLKPALNGNNMGVISDAGCPGVADPGAEIVKLAHEKNIQVVPLVGPSSILLSLMASGMSGQSFAFSGYLPKERKDRIRRIRELEKLAVKQTQIFMDTPYRSHHVLEDLLATCHPETNLCIASNISLPKEYIKTRSIADWKKNMIDLTKKPCMFLLGRQ